MTISYEAKRYSQGRLTVMGIATLMIAWFHSNVNVPEGSLIQLWKLTGDLGVDMFLLASGMGVYLSLEKRSEFRGFMANRLRRVLPVFLIATIPWFLYQEFRWGGSRDLVMAFLNASTLTYWFGSNLTCWYVSSILALYLVTPGYVKLWKKHPRLNAVVIGILYVFGYVCVMQLRFLDHLGIFLLRIPVYLMGLYLGKAVKEERIFRIPLLLAGAVAALMAALVVTAMNHSSALIPWSMKYFAYGPLAVMLSFLLSYLPAGKVIGFLGRRSLEIYLLYEKTIEYMSYTRPFWVLFSDTNVRFALVAFAIALVGAEILARMGSLILKIRIPRKLLDKKEHAQ